jgi:ferredoxin
MSIWVLRGLRDGVVTTRWPRRPDAYADGWRGPARALAPADAVDPALCPTGAISAQGIDQGRCILCGRCVAERPDLFAWSQGATGPAAAGLSRDALVVPEPPETDEAVEAARARLRARTAALRRSVHIRHVDAGSDGSEEWEIQALLGPVYDIGRLGVFFTASPRLPTCCWSPGPAPAACPGRCIGPTTGCPIPRSSSRWGPTPSAAGC